MADRSCRDEPCRIVVVDDAPEYRQVLAIHLEAHGLTVVADAEDGATGLAAVEREQPDLVVTDLQMPGTDGLWLAERLRDAYPQLPVVMATSSRLAEVSSHARSCGVSRLVSKGAGPQAVVAAVQEQLARAL